MPHARSHLDALTSDLPTHSSDDLVESNIALQRVRPRDIIVEVILRAHDEPGGLATSPSTALN